MASIAPTGNNAFADPETGAGAGRALPPLRNNNNNNNNNGNGAKLDPRRALAQFRKKDPSAGSVRLDTLPPNLRAVVAEFDDGDGEINLTELAATLSALQTSRKDAKHYARLACLGGAAGLVMMLIVLGLTFLSVKLATPTGVEGGSLVVAGTNDPVRVASAEFEVKDGSMKQRDGSAVTVSTAATPAKLNSQLPDSYFMELRFIQLKSPNGANLHLDVSARARVPKKLSSHGNIIQLITPVGTLTLDGEVMSFDDKTAPILESAGFELHSESTSSGRRLAAGHEVIGWFNVFAKLTEHLGEDQSATFPEGDMSFTMTRYEKCGGECYGNATSLTVDGTSNYNPNPNGTCPALTADAERDGKTILYGVVTIDGVDYNKETVTTQVKTVNGVAVSRTTTLLDRFPGHALVELAAGSEKRTFQTYGGAMYHCSNPNAGSTTAGSSGASAEDIQAVTGSSDSSSSSSSATTVTYEGLTKVGERELRKYVVTTTASLAVATGFGTINVFDDGEVPVRMEAPGAGLIMDITDVLAAPAMDDALFTLPSCPAGAAEHSPPDMHLGGAGICVEDDAQDPWDATVEEGNESGSSGTRRVLHMDGLTQADMDKLAEELEAGGEQAGEHAVAGGGRQLAIESAAISYSGGLCSGVARKTVGSTSIEIEMSCDGRLWNDEIKLSGGFKLWLETSTGRVTWSRSTADNTMRLEVRSMSAIYQALLEVKKLEGSNALMDMWVAWGERNKNSWGWSNVIPATQISHRLSSKWFYLNSNCRYQGMGSRRNQPGTIMHYGGGTMTQELDKLWPGPRFKGQSYTVYNHVLISDWNLCPTDWDGSSFQANSGVATMLYSSVRIKVAVDSYSVHRVIRLPHRSSEVSAWDANCFSQEANKNVWQTSNMAFNSYQNYMVRTGAEKCNPRYNEFATLNAAFRSSDLATAVNYHFGKA